MDQRMSIITLGVSDLKQSRSFYESLGWEVATEQQSEDIVAFNLQSFVLALYPREDLGKDADVEMSSSANPSFTLAYNVNSEDEVDRTINEVRNVGAKIVKEPQKVFWGGYSSYFSDPDGYLWEVAFAPDSKVEKDGSFQWE